MCHKNSSQTVAIYHFECQSTLTYTYTLGISNLLFLFSSWLATDGASMGEKILHFGRFNPMVENHGNEELYAPLR